MLSVKPLEPSEVEQVDAELPLSRLGERPDAGSMYLIAWEDDRPLGHAHLAWHGTHLGLPEIQDVYVSPQERRRGIATELTRAAEGEARGRGWSTISLSVSLDGNPEARRLYERLGFADAGVEPERVCGEIVLRGRPVRVDDTLLYLIKSLKGRRRALPRGRSRP